MAVELDKLSAADRAAVMASPLMDRKVMANRATRARRRPTKPVAQLLEPSTMIARFSVEGRAVPWSVPPKIRQKNPALTAWQTLVWAHAGTGYQNGQRPYLGPVELTVEIWLKPKGNKPDLTNCFKAIEDAIQGALIANDTQVRVIHSAMFFAEQEKIRVTVHAYGGRD